MSPKVPGKPLLDGTCRSRIPYPDPTPFPVPIKPLFNQGKGTLLLETVKSRRFHGVDHKNRLPVDFHDRIPDRFPTGLAAFRNVIRLRPDGGQ